MQEKNNIKLMLVYIKFTKYKQLMQYWDKTYALQIAVFYIFEWVLE